MKQLLLLLIIGFVSSLSVFAQDTQPVDRSDSSRIFYAFTLRGGRIITGKILEKTDSTYRVQTRQSGKLTFAKDQVISVRALGNREEDLGDGDGYFLNKFTHKLLFTPTAIPLERGKAYFSNTYLAFSNFSYGISDHWSVGVNTIWYSPYNVNTKVTFNPKAYVKIALYGQYFWLSTTDNNGVATSFGAGYIQAMLTSGEPQNNITLGIGRFLARNSILDGSILTIGGVKKIGPKVSFVMQNHLLMGRYTSQLRIGMLMPAFRLDRATHSFDLGAFIPFVNVAGNTGSHLLKPGTYAIALPYAGLNVKIN